MNKEMEENYIKGEKLQKKLLEKDVNDLKPKMFNPSFLVKLDEYQAIANIKIPRKEFDVKIKSLMNELTRLSMKDGETTDIDRLFQYSFHAFLWVMQMKLIMEEETQ